MKISPGEAIIELMVGGATDAEVAMCLEMTEVEMRQIWEEYTTGFRKKHKPGVKRVYKKRARTGGKGYNSKGLQKTKKQWKVAPLSPEAVDGLGLVLDKLEKHVKGEQVIE